MLRTTRFQKVLLFFVGVFLLYSIFAVYSTIAFAQNSTGLSEQEQTRLRNLSANMSNRMDATASRLLQIGDRLESRSTKEAPVADVMDRARVLITANDEFLLEIQRRLSRIDMRVEQFVTASDPATDWVNVRTEYLEIKQMLRSAQQNLVTAHEMLQEPETYLDVTLQTEETASSSPAEETPAVSSDDTSTSSTEVSSTTTNQ